MPFRAVRLLLGVAVVLAVLGWGLRCAEMNGVGETNDVSNGCFVLAGLFAYYALLRAWIVWRRMKKEEDV